MAPWLRVVGILPSQNGQLGMSLLGISLAPRPRSPQRLPHSRHPGSPCGPAFAGRYNAYGRCCRRGRYLGVRGTESGVGLLGKGEAGIQSPTITSGETWLWGGLGTY